MNSTCHTRASLLIRLQDGPEDAVAWEEFVRIYGRQVIRWCRHHGLQATDAEDVAQDILAKFWKMAGSFEYDPQRRFRGYLRQMVVSAVSDWSSRRATRPMKGGDDAEEALTSLPARDDLVSRIEEAYDTELLGVAMNAVKARVEPHTWKAFELLAGSSASKIRRRSLATSVLIATLGTCAMALRIVWN